MKIINYVGLALLLTHCASVVRLPTSTGQTPVVGGGFLGGKIGLDISRSIPVTVINDVTTNPPTRNAIKVGQDDNVIGDVTGIDAFAGSRFELSLGLLQRLDIYYTGALGARFMVFGKNGEKGWKGTVFAGASGYGQTDSTGSDPNVTSTQTQMSATEYGFSVGRRFDDPFMLYLTLASRGGKADIKVTSNSTETGSYKDEFDHYIGSFGLLFGESFFGKVEVSGNYIEWRGQDNSNNTLKDSSTEFGATAGFGYMW
ncbi:MAG: hypothetical protein KDD33_01760 [Bdellovibrionales bacterium]|nr:hypothetical protein [Bdellovibrionales bacterium]